MSPNIRVMKSYIILPILLLFVVGCSQIKEKHITEISQEDLRDVVLVDVRTPIEFNEGHLENSINIDWTGDSFVSEFEKISKEDTIYLYCRSGRRSANATKYLGTLGYKNVYNLKGGYIVYSKQED